ncbi:unnamed protein product [Pseudo-nitzschia multistriata]|uniref:CRAL-TRIO domain-containing protein n=1 Tax=Pseudo-nitzschia multistriata TaxID=183589 RepID=A0A448YYX2_9STRA|nr:unnamed protein product [Pseudo-nitzschia multistriata]
MKANDKDTGSLSLGADGSESLDCGSTMSTSERDPAFQQQQQQQHQEVQGPFRASKRRASELHRPLEAKESFGEIQRASSQDMGVQGLEVSDFEQMRLDVSLESTTTTTSSSSSRNNKNTSSYANSTIHGGDEATGSGGNSYFCIGSGAGCVDRSVSQTCLTRELDQLPINHREHVGQDLYGLAEECIPNIDESLLSEFEEAIVSLLEKSDSKASSSVPAPSGTGGGSLPITDSVPELQSLVPYHAYRLALSMSPSYVKNPEFRLMFLRATEGDVKKAAKRLTRHFKTKLRLFGEDKLVRDIVLDDLSEDDMESLKSGGFQVLSKRDAAGRSVLFGRYTSMRYKTIDNMLRALWYIWMSILEDPTNQKKGVVALGYEVGRVPLDRFDGTEEGEGLAGFELGEDATDHNMSGGFDRTLARKIVSVPLSVPARPVGYHLCTDSHQWVGMLNMVMVTLCKFIRLRMRIHHGTDVECKYALMTHGMPTDSVPVDEAGCVSLAQHMEWIEGRRVLDARKTKGRTH